MSLYAGLQDSIYTVQIRLKILHSFRCFGFIQYINYNNTYTGKNKEKKVAFL
jgi:hypothetical protein